MEAVAGVLDPKRGRFCQPLGRNCPDELLKLTERCDEENYGDTLFDDRPNLDPPSGTSSLNTTPEDAP